MAGKLLKRKAQVALEEESVEGTAETLAAADATMLVYDPTFQVTPQRTERNPARSTLSQLAPVIGMLPATMSFRTELKGSGAADTEPAWDRALRCCGLARAAVGKMTIGAVTSGPFVPGETVTGGTSSATGRVVGQCVNGDAAIYIVVLSGTFQSSETLTGGTSGATATSSSTVTADSGFEWRPASSSVPSATAAMFMDGLKKTLYGARGNLKLNLKAGEPAFLAFDFKGVYQGTTDTALLSPTYETPIPLAFLNCGISLQGLSAIFSQVDIDMGNVIAERTSAGSTAGILSYLITGRAPSGSIDPEMELVADHDFMGKLVSGATGRFYVELPSDDTAEKITIAAPRIQYSGISDGDRAGIAVAQTEFALLTSGVSAGDDELQIAMITGG
jgi:hypothetical protein